MLIQIIAITCSYLSTDAEQVQCAQRILQCAKDPLNRIKGQAGFSECVYDEQLAALELELKHLPSKSKGEGK